VLIELGERQKWEYRFDRARSLVFASVSPRDDSVRIEVSFNGELVERLTTTVPHSWWKYAGNALFPGGEAVPGDVLVVESVQGDADVRVDFE
jgi:hypothetical protein